MKTILLSILGCALAVQALAQYTVSTLTHSLTNVPGATLTNLPSVVAIETSDAPHTAIQVQFKLHSGVETGGVAFRFRPLLSLAYVPTVALSDMTLVVAANGTTTVRATTNWPTLGYGYLSMMSVSNVNTAEITNLVVTYSTKRSPQ